MNLYDPNWVNKRLNKLGAIALARTKKLIIFPVIAPRCFLPKKRGQATAFKMEKNPPEIPNPAISKYNPKGSAKNKNPIAALKPPII